MTSPALAFIEEFAEALLVVKANGRVLACNRAARHLFSLDGAATPNLTLAELTGMPAAEVAERLRECLGVATPVPMRLSLFPVGRAPRICQCEGWRCGVLDSPAALLRMHTETEHASRFMCSPG